MGIDRSLTGRPWSVLPPPRTMTNHRCILYDRKAICWTRRGRLVIHDRVILVQVREGRKGGRTLSSMPMTESYLSPLMVREVAS